MLKQTPASRAGFTLVELMTALVMLAIVGNAILALLIAMQRITRQQSELAAMQGSLRSGVQLLQGELVELAAEDLTSIASARIGYRAMRGLGESCGITTGTVTLRKAGYAGLRPPTPGRDGLWIYLEGDSISRSDDRWLAEDLTGVAPGTCPDGGDAWSLSIALDPADLAQAQVPGPIRTYELMEIGQVEEAGRQWLGIRSIGLGEEGLVPVTGPVTANGLQFAFLDAADAPTSMSADVRTIVATLRGVSDRPVGTASGDLAYAADSLTLRIRLRN